MLILDTHYLIAATSVVHEIPLLTRDAVMRGSKIVSLAS